MEIVACNIVEIPVAKLWKNNLQLSVKNTCKKHAINTSIMANIVILNIALPKYLLPPFYSHHILIINFKALF